MTLSDIHYQGYEKALWAIVCSLPNYCFWLLYGILLFFLWNFGYLICCKALYSNVYYEVLSLISV